LKTGFKTVPPSQDFSVRFVALWN